MRVFVIGILLAFLLPSRLQAAQPAPTDRPAYAADVCALLNQNAERNGLPINFLTRLIWKESIFDERAVSPVGAEGIAQFMPGTAKLRGLGNSFDYREALPAAAVYLAFLAKKFGNVGLAAVAYNFGEDGTGRWLGNRLALPDETEDYVLAITGHTADEWRQSKAALDIPGLGGTGNFMEDCIKLVLQEMSPTTTISDRSPRKPWGVIIAGGFSESQALVTFSRVKSRYAALLKDELPMIVHSRNLSRGRKLLVRVMIGRNSRSEAEVLCTRLSAQGAACIVGKN